MGELAVAGDSKVVASQAAVVDILVEVGVEPSEARCIEAQLGGIGGSEVCGHLCTVERQRPRWPSWPRCVAAAIR